jgi:Flp pilus assembly pilin Flp
LYKLFKSFQKDEDGAVTADWVVLTSGIVILGAIVIAAIAGGTNSLTSQINGQVIKAGNTFIASQYW